jgi:drug/metabolite transporter (DMT)-like permease
VISVLAGLLTALCWTGTTLTSARASRDMGAASALAIVMSTGFVIVIPFIVFAPLPDAVRTTSTIALLAVAGFGNMLGLLLLYRAYATGLVAIVSAISSTEGSIAAVVALVLGEALAPPVVGALAIVAVGVTSVAAVRNRVDGAVQASTGRPAASRMAGVAFGFASAAAVSFGISLYAVGRASIELPLAWAVLPARAAGVLAIAIPLVLLGRLHVTRAGLPWAIASGVLEVVGIVTFGIGARDAIAVTAVLTCLFVPLTAILAVAMFGERLARAQVAAIIVVVIGVGLVGAFRST